MNSLTRLANRVSAGPRMLRQMKRGQRFGQHLTCDLPPSGTNPEPGWLESYFDHHQTGPGIDKWRHYFPIYEQHLSKFRGQEVHLVEIGVFSGGSLGMWQSYLGPGAHIYGVDIAPECRSYAREGVEIFVGDQADPAFWRDFKDRVPRIDVVIDDGGHMAFQQIATLEALLPALQPGGIYLCEDIHFQFSEFSDYLFGLGQNLNTWGRENCGPARTGGIGVPTSHPWHPPLPLRRRHQAPGRIARTAPLDSPGERMAIRPGLLAVDQSGVQRQVLTQHRPAGLPARNSGGCAGTPVDFGY